MMNQFNKISLIMILLMKKKILQANISDMPFYQKSPWHPGVGVLQCHKQTDTHTAQPAIGVLGNILIPSSRKNGLCLKKGQVHADSGSRPVIINKWRHGCCVEGIADFSDSAYIWSKCRLMYQLHLGAIIW